MRYEIEHVPPNPTLEYAESIEIGEEYTEIVSKGGGSTIDVGKYLAKKYGLKHTAIPTTAGTGSEVTPFVVLRVDGRKKTFTDDAFIPDSYVFAPNRVVSLPGQITISSGLDAYSQAWEAIWSKNATIDSTRYAEMAIFLIEENLKECVINPENEKARMNMLIAANFSGRAITITKTNVCHAISYPLTDLYDIPHGIACALTLPYFVEKFTGIDIKPFIKEFEIQHYEVNKQQIAEEVIQSPKLQDCSEVTVEDILASLGTCTDTGASEVSGLPTS